jgi:hypothetical protein
MRVVNATKLHEKIYILALASTTLIRINSIRKTESFGAIKSFEIYSL